MPFEFAAQNQRLMREWNRYQLLVFLESTKQFALTLLQPTGDVSLAYPLVEVGKPLAQVIGQILLPDVKISIAKVNQFLKELDVYQHASLKA